MKTGIKKSVVFAIIVCFCISVTACGQSGGSAANYKDGKYTGRSEDHQDDQDGNGAGYGEVTLEIKDNKVTSCTFEMFELDGKKKDDSYGSGLSKENRLKAQKAVQSASKYASMLVEKGSIDSIDAISGATISHSEFKEAVKDALSKAK